MKTGFQILDKKGQTCICKCRKCKTITKHDVESIQGSVCVSFKKHICSNCGRTFVLSEAAFKIYRSQYKEKM